MMRLVLVALLVFAVCEAAVTKKEEEKEDCKPKEKGFVIQPGHKLSGCSQTPMDISFVVDASASIEATERGNFQKCLTFIQDFLSLFTINRDVVRASFVTFGVTEYVDTAFNFDDHTEKKSLLKTIAETKYKAGTATNTGAGIRYMLQHQLPEARDGVRHVAIVITDGQSQNKRNTKEASDEAHAHEDLEMFAIGVGKGVSQPELHTIASDSRHVLQVESYDMLEAIKGRLAFESCAVPTFPECEMDPVDLAFVIDSSTSIGADNFTAGMDFIRNFVEDFDVKPSAVRVAAVTFGQEVFEDDAFHFNDFKTKQEVQDRLKKIKWRHGTRTETGMGIEYMRQHLMKTARPGVAHVCIVITDGNSQDPGKTRNEAKKARHDHVVMYAVGVGSDVGADELMNIAGDQRHVIRAESYNDLNLIKNELINVTCNGILTSLHAKGQTAESNINFNAPGTS